MLSPSWYWKSGGLCVVLLLLAWMVTIPPRTAVEGVSTTKTQNQDPATPPQDNMETITLGAGCFWCTEAVFLRIKGVSKVASGYSGGRTENPSYRAVTSGATGHAEVVQVTFDPSVVGIDKILEVFWSTHDPTTLNRQGADVGTQYRSAIFYHTDKQRERAEFLKQKLEEAQVFDNPIVTQIEKFNAFYPAEDYHQDYYARNPNQGYCQAVIRPKVEKLQKAFADLLKD